MIQRHSFDEQVDFLDRLRPFPATATRLLELSQDLNVDIAQIIQLIECDPKIASKVLALANSPLYGTTRQINSINQSVVLLGMKTVSNVAISLATGELFSQGSDAGTQQYCKRVFNESIACASICRVIAHDWSDANPDEAFLAGIMQDVGKLVFIDTVFDEYTQVAVETSDDDLPRIETEMFGVDHAEMGNRCATRWGLPGSITEAIKNHHLALASINHALSEITILGNFLARLWGLGFQQPFDASLFPEKQEFAGSRNLIAMEEQCRESYSIVNEICAV